MSGSVIRVFVILISSQIEKTFLNLVIILAVCDKSYIKGTEYVIRFKPIEDIN